MDASNDAGARGTSALTAEVFHARSRRRRRMGQNGVVRGGTVTPETQFVDVVVIDAEVEELLIEEVSIDGLCGVY